MAASANCPVKNPTTDPTEARKASLIDRPCLTSINKTTIKGSKIIPKGGKIKEPTMTDNAAPFSPNVLPPNFFTESELAKISAKVSIMVKIPIAIQKNSVNSLELIKK